MILFEVSMVKLVLFLQSVSHFDSKKAEGCLTLCMQIQDLMSSLFCHG